MYDIEIKYKTGNSFGSHEEIEFVDKPVKSLEVAKENLRRIKEHAKIYYKKETSYLKKDMPEIPHFYDTEYDGLFLMINENTPFPLFVPFWVGFFEQLISAKIVNLAEDELEFEFNPYEID